MVQNSPKRCATTRLTSRSSAAVHLVQSVGWWLIVANGCFAVWRLATMPCLTYAIEGFWWVYGCYQLNRNSSEEALSLAILGELIASPLGPFLRHLSATWPELLTGYTRSPRSTHVHFLLGGDAPALKNTFFTTAMISLLGLGTTLASALAYTGSLFIRAVFSLAEQYGPSWLVVIYRITIRVVFFLCGMLLPGFTAMTSSASQLPSLSWQLGWSHLAPPVSVLCLWHLYQVLASAEQDVQHLVLDLTTQPTPYYPSNTSQPPLPMLDTATILPSRALHPSLPAPCSVDVPSCDSIAYFTHPLQVLYSYVLPTALLTPFSRPELLSACSIPVPTSVMVATYATLRHVQCLNDKSLSGRVINSPGTPPPESPIAPNLTFSQSTVSHILPQSTPVRFDVVDMIQCIADTFAGIAARYRHQVVLGRARRLPSRSADTAGDSSWPQLEPLNTPHQDLVAWIRGPYDQWYHLLCLIHGTILPTIPKGALLEFDFYLCTYTGPKIPPKESDSTMTAEPESRATRALACVFRWTIRHPRLSRASTVTETTGVLRDKLESVNEILTQLGLPRIRSTWKTRSGSLSRKPSGREPSCAKASADDRKGRANIPSPRSSPSGSYAIGLDLFLPCQQASEGVPVDNEAPETPGLLARCSSGPLSAQPSATAQGLAHTKSLSQSDTQRPTQPPAFPPHLEAEDYFTQPKAPHPPMLSATGSRPMASLEEASAAQVSEFMALLKGLPIALHASMNSKFAHRLVEFFTHRAMADVATFQLVTKCATSGNDKQPSTGSSPTAQRISREGIPWDLNADSSHRRPRRPWAFVIVDDDLSTLCEQFRRLRNTLTVDYRTSLRQRGSTLLPSTPYSPFTPSGETPGEGTLSPVTHLPFLGRAAPAPSQGTPSPFPESSSASALRATTLVYFTSLPHYQETKAALHELVNEQHTLPPPDVLVLPKPAGMKRLVAALYGAIYQPLLNGLLLPLSHPAQSPLVTPADSTHRTPTHSPSLVDNLLFNPSLYSSTVTTASTTPALQEAHVVPHFIPDVLYQAIMTQHQHHLVRTASTKTLSDVSSKPTVGSGSPLRSHTGILRSTSIKSSVSASDVPDQVNDTPQRPTVTMSNRGSSSAKSAMLQRSPSGKSPSLQSVVSLGDNQTSSSSPLTNTNANIAKPVVPPSTPTKTSQKQLGGETSQSVAKPPSKGAAKMRSRLEQMRKNAARRKQAAAAQASGTSPEVDSVSAGETDAETKSPDISRKAQVATTKDDATSSDAVHPIPDASTKNDGSDPIPALTDTGKPPILTTSNSSPLALFSTPYPSRGQYGGEAFFRGVTGMAIPPIKVLIVEDSLVDRRIIGRFMNNHGIKHDMASTGKEAIEKWNLDVFHLVFMDLQLPDMSGIEITREIRRLEALRNQEALHKQTLSIEDSAGTPLEFTMSGQGTSKPSTTPPAKGESSTVGTPTMLPTGPTNSPAIIVALTASNLESDRMEAYAAGCNDFLIKPIDTHWMRQKLLEWGAMHALIDFEGFKNWKVADAKRQEAKVTSSVPV
ncbi:response regulator [Dispira parvispora]|uniref:Response regulator n=1 Tax=Dispira parvispora TaxID=1520584 RepID=A0A9W8AQZ5_9FUNG|nr:response regulator [Dispira parvispora]